VAEVAARKVVPGNARVMTVLVHVPDRWGIQAASLGVMTNTFSPASRGVHDAASPIGYIRGLLGHGVNRGAGRTPPMQHFGGAYAPAVNPKDKRLGIGAGVSGQPGLPSTGTMGGVASLGWLSLGQVRRTGMTS
jgi:hypothetical protein